MSNRVYESMVRFTLGPWVVRVWRTEDELAAWTNNDLKDWAAMTQRHVADLSAGLDLEKPKEIFAEIEKFPRVSAIEILLSDNGNGFLLYPDWQ